MAFNTVFSFAVVTTATLTSFAGVLFLAVLQEKSAKQVSGGVFFDTSTSAEFIFDGEDLVDATPAARSILPQTTGKSGFAWGRLLSYLEPRFPDAAEQLKQIQSSGHLMLTSTEGVGLPLLLRAEYRGGLTRISLIDTESDAASFDVDGLTRRAVQEELDQLRATVAQAPLPIWRETALGDVIWANARYLDLATEALDRDEDLSWPLPRLFDRTASSQGAQNQRLKLQVRPDGPARWFDLIGCDDAGTRLGFALPADALVQTEGSLHAFMQTLTKTFAQLPTGLAIFDDQRRLAMFNPALTDITGLPPDMLSGRPTLVDVFDALREKSMIPEPRDYRSWRSQITDLEKAASTGFYEDVWSLPSGQTFRVTGRPHPNGSLALLFADISTEVTQTRRFRADLELGEAVIDAMDEAIAVFSSAGVLVMSNTAYSDLWGHDPAASLGQDGGVSLVCDHWRTRSAPATLWDRAEDYIATIGPREIWSEQTFLADGRALTCRFMPLAGGATLAGFRATWATNAEAPVLSGTRKTA